MIENKGFIKDESKFIIFPIIVLSLFFVLKKIVFSSEIVFFLFSVIVCIFIIVYIFKLIKSKFSKKNKQEIYSQIIDELKEEGNQLIVLFFGYYLLKINFRESEAILSSIFMMIFIFIVIRSEFLNKNKRAEINISIENNLELSKKEIIKTYVKKEFVKIVLIQFLLISTMVFYLSVAWYGSLIEYLKHDTLQLFTSDYYIHTAISYGHPMNEYFQYIQGYLGINIYLWIIPFCMAIIYVYIAYWTAHKIVDRSGVGATKRLNFFYFFFIFGISNILARLIVYGTKEDNANSFLSVIFVGYVIYKIIKIGVLKIEEKFKK